MISQVGSSTHSSSEYGTFYHDKQGTMQRESGIPKLVKEFEDDVPKSKLPFTETAFKSVKNNSISKFNNRIA